MKKLSNSIAALVSLLSLFFFALSSCEKAVEKHQEQMIEKSIEKSTGEEAEVDLGKEKITLESEKGKVEIESRGQEWPDEAPADVPKFKYGTIKGTIKGETPTDNTWAVTFENVGFEALEKYEADLKKAGFTTTSIKMNDNAGSLMGEKNQMTVSVMLGEGKAVLGINKSRD